MKLPVCYSFAVVIVALVVWWVENQHALLKDPLLDYSPPHEMAAESQLLVRTEFRPEDDPELLRRFVQSYAICPLVGRVEVVLTESWSGLAAVEDSFVFSKTHCPTFFLQPEPQGQGVESMYRHPVPKPFKLVFFSPLDPLLSCPDLTSLASAASASPLTLASPVPLLHSVPPEKDVLGMEWVFWNGFYSFVAPKPAFLSTHLLAAIKYDFLARFFHFFALNSSDKYAA